MASTESVKTNPDRSKKVPKSWGRQVGFDLTKAGGQRGKGWVTRTNTGITVKDPGEELLLKELLLKDPKEELLVKEIISRIPHERAGGPE